MDIPKIPQKLELEYKSAKHLMSQGTDFSSLPSKLKRAVLNYQKLKLGKSRSEAFKKSQVKAADSLVKAREAEEAEYRKLDKKLQGIWIASNMISMGAATKYVKARENFEQKNILKGIWYGLSGTLDCAMAATCFRGAPALFKAAGQGLKAAWAARGMMGQALKSSPKLLKQALSSAKESLTRIKLPKVNPKMIISGAKNIPSEIYPYFKSGEKFVDGMGKLGFAKFGLEEAVRAGEDFKEGKILDASGHIFWALSTFPAVKSTSFSSSVKGVEKIITPSQKEAHNIIASMVDGDIRSATLKNLQRDLEVFGPHWLKKLKNRGVKIKVVEVGEKLSFSGPGVTKELTECIANFNKAKPGDHAFHYNDGKIRVVFLSSEQLHPVTRRWGEYRPSVHETSHAIDSVNSRIPDKYMSEIDGNLLRFFENCKYKGKFPSLKNIPEELKSAYVSQKPLPRQRFIDPYQGKNVTEYFAEGVEAYLQRTSPSLLGVPTRFDLWMADRPLYKYVEKMFLAEFGGKPVTIDMYQRIERLEMLCGETWPGRQLKILNSSGGTVKGFREFVEVELSGPLLAPGERKSFKQLVTSCLRRESELMCQKLQLFSPIIPAVGVENEARKEDISSETDRR